MKQLFNTRSISLMVIMGVLLLSSCVPMKKMLLLKDAQMADENKSIEYRNERSLDYKIQPGDNLFIRAINEFTIPKTA